MFDQNFLIILYFALALLTAAFVAVFLYFYLLHRREKTLIPHARKSVFLEIQVPKQSGGKDQPAQKSEDEKKQMVSVAEQIFTTLSEIGKGHGVFSLNDYISFEIVALNKKIGFFINCSPELQDLVEKQVHAQYPSAQIEVVSPYNTFLPDSKQSIAELGLQKKYFYPIRTYKNTESDPLNALTNAMSKLEENESCVIQIVVSAASNWQESPRKMALEIQQGKSPELVEKSAFSRFVHEIMNRGGK